MYVCTVFPFWDCMHSVVQNDFTERTEDFSHFLYKHLFTKRAKMNCIPRSTVLECVMYERSEF